MGMQKHVKRVFTIGASVVFGLGILSSGVVKAGTMPSESTDTRVMVLESVRQNYMASQRTEQLRGKLIEASARTPLAVSGEPGQWLRRVKGSSVNMVTNRLFSGAQKVVSCEGKEYYVPNDDYGFNLMLNRSLRYAADPVTGRKIDKSDALAYADSKERVLYFESEQSYKNFISLFGK